MNTLTCLNAVAIAWLIVSPVQISAAQTVGLATTAIERHNSVSLHNWRFDRLSTEGDEKWRERCKGIDFHKAECRLLTVDDQPADDAAQKRYLKKNPQPVEENLPNLDPTDFVNVATLALDTSDDDVTRFAFDGSSDTPEDYVKEGRLKGFMLVDREDGYIREISMANSEVFKPATGVKIKTVNIKAQFVSVDEQVFASSVHMAMQGRAFGLKKLEQDQVISFENFTPPQ